MKVVLGIMRDGLHTFCDGSANKELGFSTGYLVTLTGFEPVDKVARYFALRILNLVK